MYSEQFHPLCYPLRFSNCIWWVLLHYLHTHTHTHTHTHNVLLSSLFPSTLSISHSLLLIPPPRQPPLSFILGLDSTYEHIGCFYIQYLAFWAWLVSFVMTGSGTCMFTPVSHTWVIYCAMTLQQLSDPKHSLGTSFIILGDHWHNTVCYCSEHHCSVQGFIKTDAQTIALYFFIYYAMN
jgi:hypothetical protein